MQSVSDLKKKYENHRGFVFRCEQPSGITSQRNLAEKLVELGVSQTLPLEIVDIGEFTIFIYGDDANFSEADFYHAVHMSGILRFISMLLQTEVIIDTLTAFFQAND